ncbi:MAG: transposase [Pseudomonadota bacterium]
MQTKPSNIPPTAPAEVPKRRAVIPKEFKIAAVARLRDGKQSAEALAQELGVRRNQLYKWAEILEQKGQDSSFKPRGRKAVDEESEVVRLRRELARSQEEVAFLKKLQAYLKQPKR